MTLLRIEYTKTDFLRYISHLDMVRLFERGLRRGNVPLIFSMGFNPHPRMAFAAPLSVGYSSQAELVDIEIEDGWSTDLLPAVFEQCFPSEVSFSRFRLLTTSKSLMSMMRTSDYNLVWSLPSSLCEEAVHLLKTVRENDSIWAIKKSKGKKDRKIDLKPMIHKLDILNVRQTSDSLTESIQTFSEPERCEITIFACLDAGSESNLKPDLLIQTIEHLIEGEGINSSSRLKVHRTALYGEGGQPLFDLD